MKLKDILDCMQDKMCWTVNAGSVKFLCRKTGFRQITKQIVFFDENFFLEIVKRQEVKLIVKELEILSQSHEMKRRNGNC